MRRIEVHYIAKIHTSHMNIEPPYVVEIPKYNKFLVRAVHAF